MLAKLFTPKYSFICLREKTEKKKKKFVGVRVRLILNLMNGLARGVISKPLYFVIEVVYAM